MTETVSLYVHWPYCTRICPYCDFNIYKNKPDDQEALVSAILADMRFSRGAYGPKRLKSIHFGGGTPSLLTGKNLGRILELAADLWVPMSNMEIGLEANPNDMSIINLKQWRDLGIERVSLGVQSFDDQVLRFLGRDHCGVRAQEALESAVTIMGRVSADLIYGWDGQSLGGWEADLLAALQTGVTHISAYQLTIEKSTAFGRAERRGIKKAVNDERSADLYELGLKVLGGHDFDQYEVSNFAKTKEGQSRHNLAYWQGADYIGVGPGAHGRITHGGKRMASICAARPKDYIEHVKTYGHGRATQETLNPQSWGQEYLLMGLRIGVGISLRRFAEISQRPLNAKTVQTYVDAGLLLQKGDRLAATQKGRIVLDSLSHELWLG